MTSPFITFLHWNVFTVIANRFQPLQTTISSYQLNGSSKLYWSWTAKDNWTTHVFRRTNWLTTRPVDTYFSFKHFSVRYCISWECSDPNSSTQGVFTSSAVQTLASLPCNNWSVCWPNYRTSQCCLLDVCGEWTLEYLSSPNCGKFCNKLYLVWSVGRNSDRTKRGKPSFPVVGTEIQTSCDFKANVPDRHYLLGYYSCLFSNVVLESPDNHMVSGTIGIHLHLIMSTFSYTKIFLTLRRHNTQIHSRNVPQPHQTNQLNIARYKKVVSTAIWLQLTLVACYLPRGAKTALRAKSGLSVSFYHARMYTTPLIFLNSSLNPILYCWKLDEVRQAVKDTIELVLCHCFTSWFL